VKTSNGPIGAGSVKRRDALRITALAGVSLALGGGLTLEIIRQAGLHRSRVTRSQMGTLVTVTVVHPDAPTARAMVDQAFGEIERLESLLSRHRPTTPLARLNREGTLPDAPTELAQVVERALEYGRLSDGAFDVTVAPLLELYTAGYWQESATPPAEAQIASALARVDYRSVRVDGSAISLARPGAAITLDGIAKGYVVDRAVATLVGAGAEHVIIGASGDMAAGGADDEPWQVGVQDPRVATGVLGVLELTGECVATSGDYMQTFTPDRRLHHIIDPRTGRSPEHTSAVTVVAPTAMDADALSTTAFVMGPEKGLALLEQLEGVEGLIVTKGQEQLTTKGFGRFRV
jgi:thiamine biosynthesis lipoprotein